MCVLTVSFRAPTVVVRGGPDVFEDVPIGSVIQSAWTITGASERRFAVARVIQQRRALIAMSRIDSRTLNFTITDRYDDDVPTLYNRITFVTAGGREFEVDYVAKRRSPWAVSPASPVDLGECKVGSVAKQLVSLKPPREVSALTVSIVRCNFDRECLAVAVKHGAQADGPYTIDIACSIRANMPKVVRATIEVSALGTRSRSAQAIDVFGVIKNGGY